MRTIFMLLKVALALAILNATVRVGLATWRNQELKEAAQRSVLFGRERPASELLAGVVAKAAELQLPVAPEHVSVQQQDARTIIHVTYVNPIEVFPNQIYPMQFSFSVEGFNALR